MTKFQCGKYMTTMANLSHSRMSWLMTSRLCRCTPAGGKIVLCRQVCPPTNEGSKRNPGAGNPFSIDVWTTEFRAARVAEATNPGG